MTKFSYLTELNEDELLIQQTAREFAEQVIHPITHQVDEQAKIPKEIIDKLFDLGFMGLEVPEKYGGSHASFFMTIIAIVELCKVEAGIGVFMDVQNTLVCNAFLRWGTQDIWSRYLPKLTTKSVGAFCLSETNSGSDAYALKTTATKKGDHYILNGSKMWITNAHEADIFLIFASIDLSKGYQGITCFIVEKNTEGLKIMPKENKLGIRASSTSEIVMENCPIPKKNILGDIGKGYKVAMTTLNEGRIGIAAQMVGIAHASYHKALQYTHERKQFGKPIAEFQSIRFELAKMSLKLELATLMLYHSARLKSAGKPFLKEASMAKYYCAEVAEQNASIAVDLFGGNGYIKEYPVEKYLRDAKVGKIYEGTSNIQLHTIASQICRPFEKK